MKQKLLALAVLAVASQSAFAALPAGVETAITGAGTDSATALAAIIVVLVGIWALRKVAGLFGR
jgi:hypothetical protein